MSAAIEATWAMAAATGWSAIDSGGRAKLRQLPPACFQSYSSTSLHPYSGVRSAATRARASVGSAAARRASMRLRISGVT